MDDQNRTDKKLPRPSLFSSFLAFPARVAGWLAASALGRFFHAYDKSCEAAAESRLAVRLKESRLHRLGTPLRNKLGELFAHSPLSAFLNRIGEILRYTETRVYGILFGTFGLYTILVFLIRHFAQWARDGERSALITGIIHALGSLAVVFYWLLVPGGEDVLAGIGIVNTLKLFGLALILIFSYALVAFPLNLLMKLVCATPVSAKIPERAEDYCRGLRRGPAVATAEPAAAPAAAAAPAEAPAEAPSEAPVEPETAPIE